MRTRASGQALSHEEQNRVFDLLGQRIPSRKIIAEIGCSKNVLRYWRDKYRSRTGHRIKPMLNGPAQVAGVEKLCFVDGCHKRVVEGTRYCDLHANTPGGNAIGSTAPLSRLMGGR